MPGRILVTGASGFIGTHCVIDLLNHGYHVRGTIRDRSRAVQLTSILGRHTPHMDRLEFAQAELTDPGCWDKAMLGCSGVIHTASPVPIIQPQNPDEIIRTAREGTLNVLTAAKKLNVSRTVLTSSVSAVWGQGDRCAREYAEHDWTDTDDPGQSPYALSKTYAEQAAWKFVREEKGKGPELTVINPSIVLGPALEKDYGTSLALVYKILKGHFPRVPRMGFEIVDVRDVAALHRLAFESAESPGRRLLCSSGFRWMKAIAQFLRTKFPDYRKTIPTKDMPNLLLKALSCFDRSITPFLPDLEIKKEVDTSPARELLGWTPRSPEEAIESGAQSLIDFGIV